MIDTNIGNFLQTLSDIDKIVSFILDFSYK